MTPYEKLSSLLTLIQILLTLATLLDEDSSTVTVFPKSLYFLPDR